MSASTVRLIFFSILLGITCIFTGKIAQELWRYTRLNTTTTTHDIQWAVLFKEADVFIPYATYTFQVEDQSYEGQTTWNQHYLNQWAAEEAIHRLPLDLTVWYDFSSPSFSSLEKIFPLKNLFYTVVLWLLVLYFWGLNRYVLKKV